MDAPRSAPVAGRLGRRNARSGRRLLRRFALPAAFLAVAGPVALASLLESLAWVGTNFPGFFLMENRVVPSVSGYDWPAMRGEVFHAQLVAVDSEPARSAADVYERVARAPEGTPHSYTFAKGGRVFDLVMASHVFAWSDYVQVYGVLFVIGFINLALGPTVAFLQPASRQAHIYVLLSFVGCLFAVTPAFLHRPDSAFLTQVYLVVESVFPAVFVNFALAFPVDRLDRPWARRTTWAAYGIALVLIVLKLEGFYRDPPSLVGLYASYTFIAVGFVTFFAIMLASYLQGVDRRAQMRIRTLLPSVAIGGALTAFAFLNNAAGGGDFPLQLGLLLVPVFYASLAYGIVNQDLFGIDRFVRWAFVYALLTVFVYASYTVLVSAVPALASAVGGSGSLALGLGFVALALAVDPLRRLALRVVDRTFYRTPWNYRETVSRTSREMTTWRSVERIMEELTQVLTREMQIESVAVCLLDGGASWSRIAERPMQRLDDVAAVGGLKQAGWASADLVPWLADEFAERFAPEIREFFATMGATMVVPLHFAGRLTGVVVLGPTRSRRSLHAGDLDLLRTLADQAALAIENARSYEALVEHNRNLNETVRQRTAQLLQAEQLASLGQLVAGVAHELNNPVGAVYSTVANLRDNVGTIERLLCAYEEALRAEPEMRRRLAEIQAELRAEGALTETHDLLDICSEGSERIRGIVRDLLIFARPDRGERAWVDIAEGLTSTIRLLADRIDRAGVRIERSFGEVPQVRANPTQLNQIWMNVLSNAIDAVQACPGDRREVRVAVRAVALQGRSWVEVEIADSGLGMSAEVRARVFEPFFTTKDVGAGTGLGLSIAHGIVRDHEGSIDIESEPGSGTVVRIRLPS